MIPHFALRLIPLVTLSFLPLTSCDRKKSEEKEVVRERPEERSNVATYTGPAVCGDCHSDVVQSYAFSHHDRALSEPVKDAVLAPFAGETLSGKHLAATFTQKDGKPFIDSPGAGRVLYTIGVDPLQQYVVEGEGGKRQVFGMGYDTRGRGAGGQLWLIPSGSDVSSGDPAHFLAPSQDFDRQCASCHASNVTLTYDRKADVARTTALTLDVSCEACHGPASRHVDLAKSAASGAWPANIENFGFDLPIATYEMRRWSIPPGEKVARLLGQGSAPAEKTMEIDSCAPCHSSRVDLGPREKFQPEHSFDDRYLLDLLDSDLYFPDGQQKGLVYTHGSFLQSKHASSGVVCSDCHNSHSTELRMPAADLCVTCHDQGTYQTEAHSMHPLQVDPMPTCVDCHMPERIFADIDKRADHSFVIARPDLSESAKLPLSCDACHTDKTAVWAQRRIEKFHGPERPPTFIPAFSAFEERSADAPALLLSVVQNEAFSVIVRASALVRLGSFGRSVAPLANIVEAQAKSKHPLLRRAAANASTWLSDDAHVRVLASLLKDPVGSVRFAAVRAHLEGPPRAKAPKEFVAALAEVKKIAENNAFRPEYLDLLGHIESFEKNYEAALATFRQCWARFPHYEPAFVNEILTLQELKRDREVSEALAGALKVHPESAFLNHEQGRALLRDEKTREALPHFKKAFDNARGQARHPYGYAYAVTLQAVGDWAEALAILRIVKKEFPDAQDVKQAIELFETKRRGK